MGVAIKRRAATGGPRRFARPPGCQARLGTPSRADLLRARGAKMGGCGAAVRSHAGGDSDPAYRQSVLRGSVHGYGGTDLYGVVPEVPSNLSPRRCWSRRLGLTLFQTYSFHFISFLILLFVFIFLFLLSITIYF